MGALIDRSFKQNKKYYKMLTIEQENFFQIVEIESISESLEVLNCIDLTVEDDESFVIGNGIISHNSAMGSILQKRDPKKEAVYALKGKIKNARSLSDLSDNREILELMQILNLDPEGQNIQCPFERVVIATDQDPDGAHITSLLINLFYLWFPWMIKQGRIQFLETPLVTVGDKAKKYFYSLDEFKKGTGKSDKGNVRYLKGLGSLSLEDWDYVMKNKRITILVEDKKTKYHLDMAFGKSAMERKKWLSSVV